MILSFKPIPVRLSVALLSSLILAPAGRAQTPTLPNSPDAPLPTPTTPPLFPFVMPWDDATPDTATNVSFLNAKPAGVNGPIIVKNGHFVESKTGQRIRFLGVNFTFESDFPSHADATKIAAHLAKLGFNIVRIHHHDTNRSPLWDKSAPGHQKFAADALDRLDFLVAELKKNGIYVNFNLHVSREFVPEDGFPQSVTGLPDHYDKRVDKFDSRMIELQKNFARDYLGHVNPYTGLSYTQDPCVAVVEINNENSLLSWSPVDNFYEKLPEPFRGELLLKWNDWLSKQYGSDEALRAAWLGNTQSTAPATDPKLLESHWVFENRLPTATLTSQDVIGQVFPDVQISNPTMPAETWQLQPQITPLNFEEGKTYAVSFRARADKTRTMRLGATVLGGDWHNVGLSYSAALTTDWQDFRVVFRASKTELNNNRISFILGNDTGNVWISNIRIEAVDAAEMFPTTNSLQAKNIGLPAGFIERQTADWVRFLTETERQYSDEMRAYLRQDLKVKANLVDSQMSYGNLSSLYREMGSDYMDDHAYWQHPSFPGTAWDSRNWTIRQLSMVNSYATGSATALSSLALNRVAGKPFSVSEYCIPAPNDFQAEMFPVIASFGALQDWDAIYHFDYGTYGDTPKAPHIQSFFALAGNPLKESFVATSALLFRTGKMAPLQNTATLQLPTDALFSTNSPREKWKAANGGQLPGVLDARYQIALNPQNPDGQMVKQNAKGKPQSAVRLLNPSSGAQYIAEGRGAVAIAGFVGEQKVQTKLVDFTFPAFGNNYAALTLASVQDAPFDTSRRLLLTIAGKAENLNMGWNEARTSVGDKWGQGPTQAEGIPTTITLTNKRIKHVWALDPTGARTQEVPVTVKDGKATFSVGPQYRTLVYEIGD